ncbi:hypothetical protein CHGG_08951 [Chaetomium globosum CBS 148.51]|uniref:Uncharacterized protein n=1 Tax=Chaetomium globosum (strain ATCC 6205 / CBS 148.51 / DSM 1962 / NBRC 6347 / NRRL 1970) TaxID=306901 RepID=Q2GSV3_CHAGB|nr:uncharacterized protein CHGG_08951 [Chaetomium globosum CBS 148.51]EAQ84937.1 hypothetical protein CHGG_08951 [Chaetomium globosum CBS 148.51]
MPDPLKEVDRLLGPFASSQCPSILIHLVRQLPHRFETQLIQHLSGPKVRVHQIVHIIKKTLYFPRLRINTLLDNSNRVIVQPQHPLSDIRHQRRERQRLGSALHRCRQRRKCHAQEMSHEGHRRGDDGRFVWVSFDELPSVDQQIGCDEESNGGDSDVLRCYVYHEPQDCRHCPLNTPPTECRG